jgi:UDP-N-acetylglucosamine--N-acetylmuramyl-(pentapeptide) pyrophosphoryl-undecaprenol N-acetylglucosamine transferase
MFDFTEKRGTTMRVLIAAGGTAGHINPALAIAGALKAADPAAEIHFAGRKEGMEYGLVTKAGYPFHHIEINGFQRKPTLKNVGRNVVALYHLALSGPRTAAILKEVRPDLVIGCGGYVSGPVVRAAAKKGIKTAIHEQNAFPGVTNKLLAKDVDVVFAASAAAVEKLGAPEKTLVVGNPVRPEILNRDRAAARAAVHAGDRTVILSFGGSLGARRINEVVAELCAWEQANDLPVLHLHATGSRGVKLFEDLEAKNHFAPGANLVVKEYIDNMPDLLAAADLVISRSGALTLAELEAMGRASILIPSPNVAENHQYYNALELQNAGAAIVIEEKDLTGVKLIETVHALLAEPGKLTAMGTAAKTLGNPKSLELITAKLLELVNGK